MSYFKLRPISYIVYTYLQIKHHHIYREFNTFFIYLNVEVITMLQVRSNIVF